MKNFPSSLIKQRSTKQGLADSASGTLKNIGSKILKNIFGGGNSRESLSVDDLNNKFNAGYERLDIEHEINAININKYQKPISDLSNTQDIENLINKQSSSVSFNANLNNGKADLSDSVYFEDPFLFSSSIFAVINNYKYILKSTVPSVFEYPKPQFSKNPGNDGKQVEPDNYKMSIMHNIVSPSLFNPFAGVDITGITEHVPLLITGNNDLSSKNDKIDKGYGDNKPGNGDPDFKEITLSGSLPAGYNDDVDLSDCTIKKLVELSTQGEKSPLGLATYRYVDFMFCKDLGKISNNHLITLRRFPGPVGDNIFQEAYPTNDNQSNGLFVSYPDIGRLVTWFGNEDNKLENICRFNYNATWKALTADIQQKPSDQQDEGVLDKLANSFSPQNNKLIGQGFSSNTGLLRWGANLMEIPVIGNDRMSNARYGWELLENYDQNKIYTPINSIWDTHKYEGKLQFNQDITLTFRYTMRSYANINPKSAFLDLLGNIMIVTYRRGLFWGGETKIVGPQGNNSVYKTADAWINTAFTDLGGLWTMISNGSFSPQELQGWLSNAIDDINKLSNGAGDKAKQILTDAVGTAQGNKQSQENLKDAFQDGMEAITKANNKYKWTDALKGMLKNQLGRPAMYAFNSLLSGEPVGPWHLTIGNPRNPIMSMGNMIITSSEIEQSGPLGIDDFPTEIKLTVNLKHGRPRDSVEIEKMYTKGRSSIYKPMNLMQLQKYKNNPNAFGDIMKTDLNGGTNTVNETETKTNNGSNTTQQVSNAVKWDASTLLKALRNI